MTNKPFVYPIVGTSFRHGATKILKVLPLNTRLELLAEPTNHVDPNAIMVNFIWDAIDAHTATRIEDALRDESPELQEEIIMSESWHLGYLPAKVAAYLKTNHDFPSLAVEAMLVFPETTVWRRSNQPHVRFVL